MFIKKILLNTKRRIVIQVRKTHINTWHWNKNCNNFYEAEYMTPESIISASDEELLTIPGVGISFVKKLRKTLGRI